MKKSISLFVVISILLLSGSLFAGDRRGANLVVRKTDGTRVRGELLAVKKNSLLLMDRESGGDVSVELNDIERIRIVKKAMTVGILGGLFAGIMIGATEAKGTWGGFAVGGGMMLGVAIGALVGAVAGIDKKIQVEGKSDSEIQEILEKLRKKARVKNYQ